MRAGVGSPADHSGRSFEVLMKVTSLMLAFAVGIAVGLAFFAFLEGFSHPAPEGPVDDPREIGVSMAWLILGFGAQALFTGRMLVQWIATEKARSSVVPVAFWWLSLIGGLMLLAYFLRRGDPVGVVGQAFGVTVYARNLIFIRRREERTPEAAVVAVSDSRPDREGQPIPEGPRTAPEQRIRSVEGS